MRWLKLSEDIVLKLWGYIIGGAISTAFVMFLMYFKEIKEKIKIKRKVKKLYGDISEFFIKSKIIERKINEKSKKGNLKIKWSGVSKSEDFFAFIGRLKIKFDEYLKYLGIVIEPSVRTTISGDIGECDKDFTLVIEDKEDKKEIKGRIRPSFSANISLTSKEEKFPFYTKIKLLNHKYILVPNSLIIIWDADKVTDLSYLLKEMREYCKDIYGIKLK